MTRQEAEVLAESILKGMPVNPYDMDGTPFSYVGAARALAQYVLELKKGEEDGLPRDGT